MDTRTFSGIFGAQIKQIESTLINKADEYATEDRLHNFKAAAELQDENATQALGGMMAKHTVSVYNMINSGEAFPKAVWEEKIGDHLTYLILLRATIVEDGLILEEETPAEQEKYPDANAYAKTVAYFEDDPDVIVVPVEGSAPFDETYNRFSKSLISEKRRPAMWDKHAGFNVMTETEEEFEKRKVSFLETGDSNLLKTPVAPLIPKTKAFTDEATRRLFPSTEKYPDAVAYAKTVAHFEEDIDFAVTPHEDTELFARAYERFVSLSGYFISEKRRPSTWDKYAGFNVMTETEEEFEKRKVGFLNTGDTTLLKTPAIPLTTEKPRHQI